MIISFIPLAELRYPSMRGFPIVSIGTVTNKLDNKDNDYLTKNIYIDLESIKSTDIIIPQFEYDEYLWRKHKRYIQFAL